jgi:hypothetical protein
MSSLALSSAEAAPYPLPSPWTLSCCRGVFWDRKNSRYRAQVGYQNKKIFLGYYPNPEDAARAYDRKALELQGTAGSGNAVGTLTKVL